MAEYIEREALKKKFCEWCNKEYEDEPCEPDECPLRTMIIEAHAADVVEVRHGKWETVKGVLTPGGDPLLRCPYCKSRESEHLCGVEHPSSWMYCPVCGAKMDGKDGAE